MRRAWRTDNTIYRTRRPLTFREETRWQPSRVGTLSTAKRGENTPPHIHWAFHPAKVTSYLFRADDADWNGESGSWCDYKVDDG